MSTQDEWRGLNAAVFRELNEAIVELGKEHAVKRVEIVCECADLECANPILLTAFDYEQARRDPRMFIVWLGHDDPSVETVIAKHGSYVLVQKQGDAAEEAIATDPH
jgi:hypothetical protein